LVTISLENENTQLISDGYEIGSNFYHPPSWPPTNVKEGDIALFGGFPGIWRDQRSSINIDFYSFSIGGTAITSVSDEKYICQLEREYWVQNYGKFDSKMLGFFGGLSGGPVFIQRNINFELVGIVYECSETFDLIYIRPLKYILKNGTIQKYFS